MADDNRVQEATSRLSTFLELLFATMDTFKVGIAITKAGDFVLVDTETGLVSRMKPEEISAKYQEYVKNKSAN